VKYPLQRRLGTIGMQPLQSLEVRIDKTLVVHEISKYFSVFNEGERLLSLSLGDGHELILQRVDNIDRKPVLTHSFGISSPARHDGCRASDIPVFEQALTNDW
jgi:hypothetical protein